MCIGEQSSETGGIRTGFMWRGIGSRDGFCEHVQNIEVQHQKSSSSSSRYVKVNQSRYRPGVAQSVPVSYGSQIS